MLDNHFETVTIHLHPVWPGSCFGTVTAGEIARRYQQGRIKISQAAVPNIKNGSINLGVLEQMLKWNLVNLHNDAAVQKPVFSVVPIESDGQLPKERPGPLHFGDAVGHPGYLVCHAHLALPFVLGNLLQRWLHALQMVNGWTRLAAEQVAQAMTYPAVVVVGNHAFWHQLFPGNVGRQKLVHQKLENFDFALQRFIRVLLLLLEGQNMPVLWVTLTICPQHLRPCHTVHKI